MRSGRRRTLNICKQLHVLRAHRNRCKQTFAVSGPRGRRFKSCLPDSLKAAVSRVILESRGLRFLGLQQRRHSDSSWVCSLKCLWKDTGPYTTRSETNRKTCQRECDGRREGVTP